MKDRRQKKKIGLAQAQTICAQLQEESLLAYWDHLSCQEQIHLLDQIASLDRSVIDQQRALLQKDMEQPSHRLDPVSPIEFSTSYVLPDFEERGEVKERIKRADEALSAGEIGCIVLAGGHGSRMGLIQPKGMEPISVVRHASFFQLIAERVAAASRRAGRPLPLALVVSPIHCEQITAYFHANRRFGLEDGQVTLLSQPQLPLLDEKGHLFLDAPSHIAEGTNGNGGMWEACAPLFDQWAHRGIRGVTVIPVDNPLADPFDRLQIGCGLISQAEVVAASIQRSDPEEKVGVFVSHKGKTKIIEYDRRDLPIATFTEANAGLYFFSLPWAQKVAEEEATLPLHKAKKCALYLDQKEAVWAESPSFWKFEKFIFDALFLASRVEVMRVERAVRFAPLKEHEGPNGYLAVQARLLARDKMLWEQITRSPLPDSPIELGAPLFYPTSTLLDRWSSEDPDWIEWVKKRGVSEKEGLFCSG